MTRIGFEDQVVVVTGAGRGLGRAHALEFGRRGAAVVVNDIAHEPADQAVADIEAAGGRAVASYDSVSTPDGGAAIIATAIEQFGTLDVLVNNAGILRPGYFDELSLDEIEATLDTHLRSSFFVTRAAWPVLKGRGYGRVIMTSSSSGLFSHQGLSNYAAAKAGVYGLTKALAYEGASHGITCNALLPFADTTISHGHPIPDMQEHHARFQTEEERALLATRRDPAAIAPLVAYLASRECTVTGQAFSACGGRYARVFVGIADGWLADEIDEVTVESIAAHFDEIGDISRHSVPMWLFEETAEVAQRLASSARG